ncbi:hypothetical protein BC828DRAFT_386914 [Blastocladiella britannica]|nr:hypothetical protein BC828DRAFT_386914 [Blastocladiella britannica]
MPLYELVAITRKGESLVRPLLKQVALSIIHRGGVVRGLQNMQERELPYRIKAHQEYHRDGQYLSMSFDASPAEVPTLLRQLKLDTRVLRATVIKAGDTLEQISGLPQSYLAQAGFPNQAAQKARVTRVSTLATKAAMPFPGTENEWKVVAGIVPGAAAAEAETAVPEKSLAA